MRYLFSCIIILLLLPATVPAQPREQFIFSHLGIRDGLASDDVMTVRQDQRGYIWIATLNGLQRYDGQRFVTLRSDPGNPHSIPDSRVFAMQMDQQRNRLWLLFGENRVGYLDVLDLSFHEVPVRMSKDILRKTPSGLFTDNKGNVLLLLGRIGITTYNEAANEFAVNHTPFTLPTGWEPVWMLQDKQHNNYWITTDSGLIKYNPYRKTLSYRGHNTDGDKIIETFSGLRYVSHPWLDSAGRFWIVSWPPRGPGPYLFSYDLAHQIKKEWESELHLTNAGYHEVHSITEQDDGTIWLTGLNLLARLGPGKDHFEFIPNNLPGEFSIRYDRVKHLLQDKERNIWVSTDKGLFRFNPSAQLFRIVTNSRTGADNPNGPDVTDILQAKNGNILVTTWGSGLFLYDKQFQPLSARYVEEGIKLSEGLNWCVYETSRGDIWRGCQDGWLFITPAGTQQTLRIHPPEMQESTVRQIVEDREGNLWLGTHRGRLVKWDARRNTFTVVHQFSTIYRLYKDQEGMIWVCTGGNGAYRINPADGAILANYTVEGEEGKKLMALGAMDVLQYNDSIFIIASDALNLLNIKTGRIRFYGTAQGLPSNSVNNIIRDRAGYLWITGGGRLCCLDLKRSVTSLFTEEDGLPASGFNEASANLLADGRIAIGRSHDFIVFDPEKIRPDRIPVPEVEITGFAVMNTWLSVDSLTKLREIRLKYKQNSVIVEFSTLTYLNSFAISYMMEGLDKNWIAVDKNKQAVYNYLPPGHYTFRVRSQNGEGIVKITSLRIFVRTPFWKAWWFYSAVTLVLAALLFWEDRARIKRKATLQKMRSDIAGNLHEEINTALNNINVLSEIARIKAGKEPEQSIAYINEIHHKSHNMIIAMDDMLWSIDPANDSMAKTIARIREFADALRNRHGAVINLQADEKVVLLRPAMAVRHEIMIIYKLALRLLAEELQAPQTSIQLDYVKSQLQLNIFAPLIRLPDNNNQVIKMIGEMKERAAAISATLDLQTDEKGTAIILAVKA